MDIKALLDEARRNPTAWVDEVEKRLDNGWLYDPRTITAESYKTGKSYSWEDDANTVVSASINAKILEIIAWWTNNLMDYMDFCVENSRFTHADKATDVLDKYKTFLIEQCPSPVKDGKLCSKVQQVNTDRFSGDLCARYYRVNNGIDWVEKEEKRGRR